MKKRFVLKMLCVGMACILAVCGALFAFAGTPAEDAHLHFNDDGKFRILNFSDLQDDTSLDSRAKAFLSRAVYRAMPDLIVLTGDNIFGPDIDSASETRPAIAQFMDVFEQLGVPVAIVFGNHDDDTGTIINRGKPLSKEEQMAIYNSYSVDISYDEGSSMAGCGTYNIPIYGSTDRDQVKFNLWMIDTGSNGGSASNYDGMQQNQIDWYRSKASELQAANGGVPVPAIAFQHIIVREIFAALDHDDSGYSLPSTAKPGSVLGETPCPSASSKYCNEFSNMKEQGDVIAIVSGHDHKNMFVVPYQGIDLINTPAAGYYSNVFYHGDDATRGARVIDVDEATGEYTTEMINLIDSNSTDYYTPQGEQQYIKEITPLRLRRAMAAILSPEDRWSWLHGGAERVPFTVPATESVNPLSVAEPRYTRYELGDNQGIDLFLTKTTDPSEAIRGLSLFCPAEGEDPAMYDGVNVDGFVWHLCDDGFEDGDSTSLRLSVNIGPSGRPMYLYATYDEAAGDPISEIYAIDVGKSAIQMASFPGFSLVTPVLGSSVGTTYANLNAIAEGRDFAYMIFARSNGSQQNVSLSSATLRQTCFDAYQSLKASEGLYTPSSRKLLSAAIRAARTGVLDDIETDHQTSVYTPTYVTYLTMLLKTRVNLLSRGNTQVFFDANGGTCSEASRTFQMGDVCGALPIPTSNRCVFDGWYTLREGGRQITEDWVCTTEDDQVWYAHWAPNASWIAGDADGDGSRDLRDVTAIVRYIADRQDVSCDFEHADVNWDGVVNLRDVALMRRYLAGGWDVELK